MLGQYWSRRSIAVVLATMLACVVGCQSEPSSSPPAVVAQAEQEPPPASGEPAPAKQDSPAATQPATEPPAADNSQPTEAAVPPPQNTDTPPADKPGEPADAQDSSPQPAAVPVPNGPLTNPFMHRIPVPDFPKDMQWLNTAGPLRKQDLLGKFVLFDFWTYCCINCMHILPELKKLEQAYPNQLIVIGVHSAKFETEKGTKNIEEAILRYEIEHPVINDADHRIWDSFGVQSWPTVMLIDPQGNAVWGTGGEIEFEDVDRLLQLAIPYYQQEKLLDETPLRFDLVAHRQDPTPLRFPGKVLADETSRRLFITDSNHNRIVIASLDGKLLDVIGSGAMGRADGGYGEATFDHPQGLALAGETLFVADTENHMLRKVDLTAKQVTTIAGTGVQRRGAWPGMEGVETVDQLPERYVGPPRETELNSPWALWVHKQDLYIAMAGPHQIWKMPLDESEMGPYAGNGREDIVDGELLPRIPYQQGYSSFAQPSGLTSDGEWLYVADSEGSSIRAVPFDPTQEVRTVVGTSNLPYGRLFEFGDRDGEKENVLLQHCLGVAYHEGKLYVADTYNNKVKVDDAKTGATKTIAGTGEPGLADDPAQFDEPAGVSIAAGVLYVADTNNHLIRTVDLASGKVGRLAIESLSAPPPTEVPQQPDFSKAVQIKLDPVEIKPETGNITLNVKLQLPTGWKLNPLAPASYWVIAAGETGPLDRAGFGRHALAEPQTEFSIPVPVQGAGKADVQVGMTFYYCQEGSGGLCKVGSVLWIVPLEITDTAATSSVSLEHGLEALPAIRF